jgi:hypothetical protein
VPLIFGMFVIVPPQAYFEVVEKVAYQGSYGEFMRLYVGLPRLLPRQRLPAPADLEPPVVCRLPVGLHHDGG